MAPVFDRTERLTEQMSSTINFKLFVCVRACAASWFAKCLFERYGHMEQPFAFEELGPRCDLDLDGNIPIFSRDTPALNDASSKQVWLQKVTRFRISSDQNPDMRTNKLIPSTYTPPQKKKKTTTTKKNNSTFVGVGWGVGVGRL